MYPIHITQMMNVCKVLPGLKKCLKFTASSITVVAKKCNPVSTENLCRPKKSFIIQCEMLNGKYEAHT